MRTEDGRAVVVKLYSDALQWKLQKELFVYDLLRRHAVDVPMPAVLAADDSKAVVPQNVLILTKLEGRHVASLVDRLDERALAAINRQLGAILRALHEVGFDAFGYVGTDGIVEPHATNDDYMRVQFDKRLGEFESLGGEPELLRALERYVGERKTLFAECASASFCHNDCHYGNVLVVPADGRWRVSGVLDFENAVAGDPLLDLARTHCFSARRSETTLAALASGYGELRAGWRDAIDLYVLYHWLELWDWFAELGETQHLAPLAADMRRLVDV